MRKRENVIVENKDSLVGLEFKVKTKSDIDLMKIAINKKDIRELNNILNYQENRKVFFDKISRNMDNNEKKFILSNVIGKIIKEELITILKIA